MKRRTAITAKIKLAISCNELIMTKYENGGYYKVEGIFEANAVFSNLVKFVLECS